jgi:hypothetical protein
MPPHAHSRSEVFVLRHFNHPFEIQRAIHPPLTPPDSVALGYLACEDRAHIRLDPPTPHFSRPEAKEQAVVSTGGDVEPEQAGNVSKKDHEASPPAMKGKAVLTVPPTTRKDRRAYTYDTSSQIPGMPPEVLGDEEDEQLVTYELVQGCYNRHPAREETCSLLHAYC